MTRWRIRFSAVTMVVILVASACTGATSDDADTDGAGATTGSDLATTTEPAPTETSTTPAATDGGPDDSTQGDPDDSGSDTSTTTPSTTTTTEPPAPVFPVGVYTKDFAELASQSSIDDSVELSQQQLERRYDRMFADLAGRGINTVITPKHLDEPRADEAWQLIYDPEFDVLRTFLDRADAAGLGVIQRIDPSGKPAWAWEHPANRAVLAFDEPRTDSDLGPIKSAYAESTARRPDLPVLTATIGELLKPGSNDAAETWPIRFWEDLDPEVRFVRYYPYRNGDDLLTQNSNNQPHSPPEVFFPFVEAVSDKPYWFIPQAFGDPNGGWFDLPSPEELSALSHMALAHGARALIAYELFPDGADAATGGRDLRTHAMYDLETGRPAGNGLLDAYTRIAGYAEANAELLLNHRRTDGYTAQVNDQDVLVVPREDIDGTPYLYVVNMKTTGEQNVQVSVDGVGLGSSIRDLFTGDTLTVTNGVIQVPLAPGQGRFLDFAG